MNARLAALLMCSTLPACEGAFVSPLAGEPGRRDSAADAFQAAPAIEFPAETDSNSPMHWSGGRLFVFNSVDSANADPSLWVPSRSEGASVESLGATRHVRYTHAQFDGRQEGRQWLEATWKDPASGVLYGWFHNEPWGTCPGTGLTAPRIGALRSFDDGATWEHLGLILVAPGQPDCSTANGYFAGGNGDFSVMLDAAGEYFYFFYSSFSGEAADQGVALAWMAAGDRDAPAGKVYRWNAGDWYSPGIGGRASPILPAMSDWMSDQPDAFWGPAIHWNRYLDEYVILLNRAVTPAWKQEGIYAMFGVTLDDPDGWSAPVRLADAPASNGWYPQVMGLDPGDTDKSAGRVARFFVGGRSSSTIDFGALRAWLGVRVTIAGAPAAGVRVTAWGHDRGDFHELVSDANGHVWFPGLAPASRYNIAVNRRWTAAGWEPIDAAHAGASFDNVSLTTGPSWTSLDAGLDH